MAVEGGPAVESAEKSAAKANSQCFCTLLAAQRRLGECNSHRPPYVPEAAEAGNHIALAMPEETQYVKELKRKIVQGHWPESPNLIPAEQVERIRLFAAGKELGGKGSEDSKTLKDANILLSKDGPTAVHVMAVQAGGPAVESADNPAKAASPCFCTLLTTVESSQPAELKKTKEPKPSARPHPPKATAAASKAPSTQKVEKPADAEPAGTGKETAVEIHVCFCSDDTDWRPLAAAINSTLTNSKRPKSLVFHLITSTELAPVVSRALITVLPVLGAQLQVHSDALVQKRIKSLISYRSSSGARKGLASAFNFAPFYLEENQSPKAPKSLEVSSKDFLRDGGLPKRLIYLDTDVLLLGDIEALWKVDMKGLPAAAVEDCSQSFDPQQNDIYIDFDEMEALGLKKTGLSKKDCVFNRGIFVMDVAKWKRMQITKDESSGS
eukprot:g21141.t1